MKRRAPSPMMAAIEELAAGSPDDLITASSRFSHSRELDVAKVEPDPDQPRKIFSQEEIMNLAKTMNQQGQLQPILVRRHLDERDRWIIVAGERRWRAAGLNGWTKILAIEHRGDHDIARLIENLQRVDLTAVEEARGLNRLITEKGWTQAEAGEVIGIHRTNVSALLRILTLPGDFLEECVTSHVPRGVLIELARLPPGPIRNQLMHLARKGRLTVEAIRDARGELENTKTREASSAPVIAMAANADSSSIGSLGIKSIEKITQRILELSDQQRMLTQTDREKLIRLRDAIGVLLGTPEQ
ncbi:MAG: ParB/RepB/Spo0J family partition protein [Acetobacteraceae bacterium]|nr:ParB/RepB/Spo0J family partition protein [Acetobacteraceae bacterium]